MEAYFRNSKILCENFVLNYKLFIQLFHILIQLLIICTLTQSFTHFLFSYPFTYLFTQGYFFPLILSPTVAHSPICSTVQSSASSSVHVSSFSGSFFVCVWSLPMIFFCTCFCMDVPFSLKKKYLKQSIKNQHTRELIDARTKSHKRSNKDLSRLR